MAQNQVGFTWPEGQDIKPYGCGPLLSPNKEKILDSKTEHPLFSLMHNLFVCIYSPRSTTLLASWSFSSNHLCYLVFSDTCVFRIPVSPPPLPCQHFRRNFCIHGVIIPISYSTLDLTPLLYVSSSFVPCIYPEFVPCVRPESTFDLMNYFTC